MNWMECDVVESVEGRCGGRPTIQGTRVWPEVITENAEEGMGVEELHDSFPSVSLEQIRAVLAFAQRKRSAA